ncbi:HNH endonuclease signature motif containing protein [Microbacterium deminutum]
MPGSPQFSDDPPPDDVGGAVDDTLMAPVPDAVDRIVEAETMMSVFAAQRFEWIEQMRRDALQDAQQHGPQLTGLIERSIRLELAAALAITESAAGRLIAHADALVNRYPAALTSLNGARMTERHAVELATALDAVVPDFRDQLIAPALALAEHEPLGTFRRKLRALIESVRSATLAERHEWAVQARRVVLEPSEDGMAWLHELLPAVEAHAIYGRLTATAKVLAARPDETRTLDQLRADVLGDILVDGVTDALPPEARGIHATAAVTVPVLALLGVDGEGRHSASVEGVGPIPLQRARELCGAADGWMRVLTHPETGVVLSVGRDRYRPPPELRRLVRWRAETCMAPGCNIPASRCEIDHTVAWDHGGTTALSNLHPLCKGHHTVKHHGRWSVEQVPDASGTLQWTSPTGRRYRVQPERRVPVFVRPDPDVPEPLRIVDQNPLPSARTASLQVLATR